MLIPDPMASRRRLGAQQRRRLTVGAAVLLSCLVGVCRAEDPLTAGLGSIDAW